MTFEFSGCKGGSHDAKRKLHHEVVDDVGVVSVGHGVMVGVNHQSYSMGGSGGCFGKEFFKGHI